MNGKQKGVIIALVLLCALTAGGIAYSKTAEDLNNSTLMSAPKPGLWKPALARPEYAEYAEYCSWVPAFSNPTIGYWVNSYRDPQSPDYMLRRDFAMKELTTAILVKGSVLAYYAELYFYSHASGRPPKRDMIEALPANRAFRVQFSPSLRDTIPLPTLEQLFAIDAKNQAEVITDETFKGRGRINRDKWRYSFVRRNHIWYLRVDLKGFPKLVRELIPNVVWGGRLGTTNRKPGEEVVPLLISWRFPIPPILGSVSPERAFKKSDRVLYLRTSPMPDGYYGLQWVKVELK